MSPGGPDETGNRICARGQVSMIMKKQALLKVFLLIELVAIAVGLMAHPEIFRGQTSPEISGYKEFGARVEAYEKLRKEAVKNVPALKKKSKPEEIATHHDALVNKIREMRSNAVRGDIFTPSATEAIARAIKSVYAGPEAHGVRNTIQAGEPLAGFKVEVNQKYPENLPFTTMPPTLLSALPRLPDEVVYRLIGTTLLLVDRRANIIIDFMPNAIP
jgi:hypothetical protein